MAPIKAPVNAPVHFLIVGLIMGGHVITFKARFHRAGLIISLIMVVIIFK